MEWRADSRKRLNTQKHAAMKRVADLVNDKNLLTKSLGELLGKLWASESSILLSELKEHIEFLINDRFPFGTLKDEICLRIGKEVENTEFRLKLGSDLGRFDQFWDDDTLFECIYSRSKWLYLDRGNCNSSALYIYSHALKRNENIIHITFDGFDIYWLQARICDLPLVTSTRISNSFRRLDIHRDRGPLFIESTYNDSDLITFAKEIRLKMDPFSTYIFTDAGRLDMHSGKLGNNARVLISFVAPTLASGQCLTLRVRHSGEEDGPLEVTLGPSVIQLNPSSNSSLTIDDIILYPVPGPSESDHLSFEAGIRNDIFIQFRGKVDEKGLMTHGHLLHDIELLDEASLKDPRNQIINVD